MPEISSFLPDVIDAYISTRAQRLRLDKEAASMKEMEDLYYKHIIHELRGQGLTAAGGAAGIVKLKELDEPEVEDWTLVRQYIKDHEAWELLHQRLGTTAVKERWEAGEQVPGVGHKQVFKLTISQR
jgi:hypothetical protein